MSRARKAARKSGEPIVFAEWNYLGGGQFQRRDFLMRDLVGREGTLFDEPEPVAESGPLTIADIAAMFRDLP